PRELGAGLYRTELYPDQENAFYNSYNTLEDNSFLEYLHNNNPPLSWDEKVEFELNALKALQIYETTLLQQDITETTHQYY
ncbi:15262_t:CDS:2, partial [Gigaspora margarita]